jgi:Cu/Ag efflux protein CusF
MRCDLRLVVVSALLPLISFVAVAQEAGGQAGRSGWRYNQHLSRTVGVIASIEADSISLTTEHGSVAVKLTSDTEYLRERQPAKLSDFKPGERVAVLTDDSTGKLVARRVLFGARSGNPPSAEDMQRMGLGTQFIFGELKAIDETKLTILRPDGQTQVIEVDENTSFRNPKGDSITLMDVKVGDRVGGRGEMKNGIFVSRVLRVGGQFASENRQPPANTKPAEDKSPEPAKK